MHACLPKSSLVGIPIVGVISNTYSIRPTPTQPPNAIREESPDFVAKGTSILVVGVCM